MEGWIDERLARWKDSTGRIAPLVLLRSSQLSCPVCEQWGENNAILKPNGVAFWHCARGHKFDSAELAEA